MTKHTVILLCSLLTLPTFAMANEPNQMLMSKRLNEKSTAPTQTQSTSLNGAILLNDKAYRNYININVSNIEMTENGINLELILTNKSEQTVRLTQLNQANNLYLLDKQKNTAQAIGLNSEITLIKGTSNKQTFHFTNQLQDKPRLLKLYDTDIQLK